MSVIDQLIEMGFSKERCEAAASATTTLEAAVEWLMNNEVADVGAAAVVNDQAEQASLPSAEAAAQSFKCNDCGKLFRDENGVMFHAAKSGHDNFSESTEGIKPLTAEEKEKYTSELREKIKAARSKKEQLEREEALEKERRRREEGKLVAERREQQKNNELRAIADERKREKVEEQEARQRILEQIRLDKEARKQKQAGYCPPEKIEPKPTPPPVAAQPAKNYDSTTIQIRLLSGQTVKQTFAAEEKLASLRAWVQTNHTDGSNFSLMTPFPRKIFSEDDMATSLKVLELVPTASLVMTRQQ